MNGLEYAAPAITALAGLVGVLLGFAGVYLTSRVNNLLLK